MINLIKTLTKPNWESAWVGRSMGGWVGVGVDWWMIYDGYMSERLLSKRVRLYIFY